MSEKELNKNYIKGIILTSNGNEELLVNEIQELCSKQYRRGLEQGKTIDDMGRLNKKLEQSEFVIEEILNCAYFNDDCPYSFIDDSWLQELCDCDNCQDTYKECWLKYFKNKCKGDNNE